MQMICYFTELIYINYVQSQNSIIVTSAQYIRVSGSGSIDVILIMLTVHA